MNRRYTIFGFNVHSDIELNCFSGYSNEPDVRIEWGVVSDSEELDVPDAFGLRVQNQRCRISIPRVARFEISGGDRIVVEPLGAEGYREIPLYLLGSAFGFLMMQRNEFPLHGSTIVWNGKGLLVLGRSGSGKTSLAAGFANCGGKIVSDDVSRLVRLGDRYCVFPSYPSQKIWASAADALKIDVDFQKPIAKGAGKYYVDERSRFSDCPVRIDGIVEIAPGPFNSVDLAKLDRGKSLNALITHTYRYECMGLEEYLKKHFAFITEVSSNVPVYRLERPIIGFTVEEQVRQIQKNLLGGKT